MLLAPSQIPERVHREIPHELEPEQIAMLVRAFGDAARRCREGASPRAPSPAPPFPCSSSGEIQGHLP